IALRRGDRAEAPCLDLGAEWKAWTTLPFVYAVWQISAGPEKDEALRSLHALLHESRRYFEMNVDALAERYAPRHMLEPARLARYWRALDFSLGERMQAGLLHYYRLAAELGEVPGVPTLRWLTP